MVSIPSLFYLMSRPSKWKRSLIYIHSTLDTALTKIFFPWTSENPHCHKEIIFIFTNVGLVVIWSAVILKDGKFFLSFFHLLFSFSFFLPRTFFPPFSSSVWMWHNLWGRNCFLKMFWKEWLNWGESEGEGISSYWMTLRIEEDNGTWLRKRLIAMIGEIALEWATDLS